MKKRTALREKRRMNKDKTLTCLIQLVELLMGVKMILLLCSAFTLCGGKRVRTLKNNAPHSIIRIHPQTLPILLVCVSS